MNVYAERARALVGCRFRPQGRDAGTGLDCIGLVAAVFRIPADSVPSDYRLRGDHFQRVRTGLNAHFRRVPVNRAVTGDVLLIAAAADQPHLAILTDRGFVHAHAGLRRVVETPGTSPWPPLCAFRRRALRKRGD